MTDLPHPAEAMPARRGLKGWSARLIASRGFQRWAAGFPLTRGLVRREGEALFELLAGFCHSQVLMALVQLDIPQILLDRPRDAPDLARQCGVPVPRMEILLRATVALGLIKRTRHQTFKLSRKGAALVGVPGLGAMIKHHDILYRDLTDPAAFFRGETKTELAAFWPYVFGGDMDAEVAATYSDLMAQSQQLVAEDTLRVLDFSKVSTVLDVGGGSGAFLEHVGRAYPKLNLMLFDLPKVAPSAGPRFARAGMAERAKIAIGSFQSDPLPTGADAISLIRVLYDHSDATVMALLEKCYATLPAGGGLFISEPMTGGATPERAGDVYFALYTLAMQTGKARSAAEISLLCQAAGFVPAATPKAPRPFVTRCLEMRKPG
ncbi:MAG: methyltransferase [Paracoccaceae bacterium]